MKKLLKNFLLISLTSIYLFGFRVIPSGNSWKINNTSSANAKLFGIYENGSSIVPNDLGAIDPRYGVANLDFDQIMASIFNDFNNIADAWVTLVDDTDSDYNATNALDRTIRIKFISINFSKIMKPSRLNLSINV